MKHKAVEIVGKATMERAEAKLPSVFKGNLDMLEHLVSDPSMQATLRRMQTSVNMHAYVRKCKDELAANIMGALQCSAIGGYAACVTEVLRAWRDKAPAVEDTVATRFTHACNDIASYWAKVLHKDTMHEGQANSALHATRLMDEAHKQTCVLAQKSVDLVQSLVQHKVSIPLVPTKEMESAGLYGAVSRSSNGQLNLVPRFDEQYMLPATMGHYTGWEVPHSVRVAYPPPYPSPWNAPHQPTLLPLPGHPHPGNPYYGKERRDYPMASYEGMAPDGKTRTRQICLSWQTSGRCKRGGECRYLHTDSAPMALPAPP